MAQLMLIYLLLQSWDTGSNFRNLQYTKQQNYQKNFSSAENYKYSYRYQTDVTRSSVKYNCQYCHYSTSLKGNLTTHLRKHTGDRPFKCDLCESSFACASNLTRHRTIHDELKPFKCNFCNYSASQKVSLISHMRHHETGS